MIKYHLLRSSRLASYDLITKYLFEMFKETTKGCIVCEDKLQCAAARSVAYHALTKLGHPTVYLNISNSYDSVFDELPKTRRKITLGTESVEMAVYQHTGETKGDLGKLPSRFFSGELENENHHVLRVMTASDYVTSVCGKAIAFQYDFVGFRRTLYGSNVQLKVSQTVSSNCPTYLAGLAVKNDRTIFTDGMFWMSSRKQGNETEYTIEDLETMQARKCIWPKQYTADRCKLISLGMSPQFG